MGNFLSSLGSGAVGGLLGGIGTLAKDIRQAVTGEISADQKVIIQQKLMELEIESGKAQSAMIVAEASSTDPWTSRARPSFMYVFYFILLSMGIFVPILGVWYPEQSAIFYVNVEAGFKAIPDSLYTLFGAGYLGYVGARGYEKVKGVSN
jgi:hypothetical protein